MPTSLQAANAGAGIAKIIACIQLIALRGFLDVQL